MKIDVNENIIMINGRSFKFTEKIEKTIIYQDLCIILFMEDDIPENNIIAVNSGGLIVWDISSVIKLPYDEAYVSISKKNECEVIVVSYSGIKTTFNVYTLVITDKLLTK